MRYQQFNEGVEFGDLDGLVDNRVSVAEFEPKTGTEEDTVVIGFYVKDEFPAEDLAGFIEKGVTPIIDTEVSPNPDDTGMYLVFVEIENEDVMRTVFNLLYDVTRLTNTKEWQFTFYQSAPITYSTENISAWLKKNR